MKIIERDIEFYTSMAESHMCNLQRAVPDQELRHIALRNAANEVRKALIAYEALLDAKSED